MLDSLMMDCFVLFRVVGPQIQEKSAESVSKIYGHNIFLSLMET